MANTRIASLVSMKLSICRVSQVCRDQLIYVFWYLLYWGYWVRGTCGTSWRELAIVLFEKNNARRSKLAGTPQGAYMTKKINHRKHYYLKVSIATNFPPQFLRCLPYCYHIHRPCFLKKTLRHIYIEAYNWQLVAFNKQNM